ncbi:hypothetical protein CR152_30180 [Massilia violaceinigra]|uniref:Arc-like DNA binding domain-containing protein n=1 Tax=Massilia violaceinigra TaxID=2045208 RepID=A0A2D2DW48_9BURK|nr:Arc family DNA-binding protein [Massilia violaceinigra]ATQ79194.1 hypothetical protein CR152_30180 [Massilia violaceinigra]
MDKPPQNSPSRDADKYIVRFPPGMRDRVTEAAKLSGRSMNAEIIQRLDTTFAPAAQSELLDLDVPRQTAMLELITLVRRLDVIDLLELVQDIVPAIPPEVIEGRPELKANLKQLRKLTKRLSVSSDEANRIAQEHQKKLNLLLDGT